MTTKKPAKWRPGMPGNPHSTARRKLVSAAGLHLVTRLAARGCKEIDISRALAMTQQTWIKRKAEDPALVDALADGRQQLHDRVTHNLLRDSDKGNVVASIWLDKTRNGYRETDGMAEARVQVIVNLPDAPTLEAYAAEPSTKALTHEPDEGKRG